MNATLIRGATICDGTGAPAYTADLLIRNERIAGIGKHLSPGGARIVNAEGLIAAPGFIDVHAHSDLSILAAPEASGKLSQGITSEISGNCGLSAFPVLTEEVRSHLNTLYRTSGIEIDWSDFSTYTQAVERRKPAINVGFLCGHNTLRANVLGYENRRGTPEERGRIRNLLHAMLEQGALGFSTGLLYIPGKFAPREELLTVAGALRDFDLPYATHLRSEGDELLESIDEALAIARAGSGHLHISHLKTALPRNWHKLDAVFDAIETARRSGLRITGDRYPYTRSQTSLSVILPPPYDKMTDAAIRETLKEHPEKTVLLVRSLEERPPAWESILLCSSAVREVQELLGRTMKEAADALGTTPAVLCAELMRRDAPGTMASFSGLSEDNLNRILAKSYICCGTDESARPESFAFGRSHPRGFGSFPRFLRLAQKELPLEEVIRKVTSLPADVFHLRNRGRIVCGAVADLVLFDREQLSDCADFATPHALSAGIFQVYVNGTLSYENREVTARAGKILKK